MRARTAALLVALAAVDIGCRGRAAAPRADPLLEVFRSQARQEGMSDAETSGKRLFEHYCATCHGELGEGDGQNSYNLDPGPPDFRVALHDDPPPVWRQVIQDGTASIGRSPLCPPWARSLSEREIDQLVAYLGVLARRPPPATP